MIKQMILKRIGKIWKDTRGKLFHQFYDGTKTLEQNIAQCPEGIDPSNWKWSLEYRMRADTQKKCTHTGGSKSLARNDYRGDALVEERFGIRCIRERMSLISIIMCKPRVKRL
ncbi:uncharacterized protein LOC110269102 isoform X3 [Arachis ipaensis]|uniref:uncharacterized protein LOC110269102 isoform X3 n=1 Tax=Arachis ipaensis TaxID=130454 RepID=UPI000A2B48F2|nr:uncharacterized protein LOC110269102 isoform X3 [Arachis ipaensis]